MPTQKQIDEVAEQFAEMKMSRSLHDRPLDPQFIFEVSRATALEVLSFALPRLDKAPDE